MSKNVLPHHTNRPFRSIVPKCCSLLLASFLLSSNTPVFATDLVPLRPPSNEASQRTPLQQLEQQPLIPPPEDPTRNTASFLTVQTGTQKVPAGTMLSITFNTLLDSRVTNVGDPFIVYLTDNFTSTTPDGRYPKVILPSGTTIRGRVSKVTRPSFFSRGGSLFLAFDHIVLPSGELLPIRLNLSAANKIVNPKGAIYTDPGIGKKVQQGFHDGQDTFGRITDKGYKAGSSIAGGLGSIVTVPAAVVGGAIAGTAITGAKAATALVGKGDSAMINPGDEMKVDFGGAFNLPSE